jgi:hypothetical protein
MTDLRTAAQQALAEPVQDGFDQLIAETEADSKGAQALEEGRRGAEPVQEPVSVTELQAALVETNLIDPDAIDDPEGYDDGSTVAQIDALHGLLFKSQRPAEPVQERQCNPHPKAPHGFMRNASHTEDRYVCECEYWEPYEAGYQAGMEAALRAQL